MKIEDQIKYQEQKYDRTKKTYLRWVEKGIVDAGVADQQIKMEEAILELMQ